MGLRANEQTLGRLGTTIEMHAEATLRSLELLRAIEDTIRELVYDRRFYKGFAEDAAKFTKDIQKKKPEKPLDSEGKLGDILTRGQEAAHRLYDSLIKRRESARNDPEVHDEDGLVDEFTTTIHVLADLHNKLNELRWSVGEHDAELEGIRGMTLKTPAEIESALKAL